MMRWLRKLLGLNPLPLVALSNYLFMPNLQTDFPPDETKLDEAREVAEELKRKAD